MRACVSGPRIAIGSAPCNRGNRVDAPSAMSISTPSPTGRSRMRVLPSTVVSSPQSAATASMNRVGVPPSPRLMHAALCGFPCTPMTLKPLQPPSMASNLAPIAVSATRSRSQSSDASTPRNSLVPDASAASTRCRFVKLLDPGISTRAESGA